MVCNWTLRFVALRLGLCALVHFWDEPFFALCLATKRRTSQRIRKGAVKILSHFPTAL